MPSRPARLLLALPCAAAVLLVGGGGALAQPTPVAGGASPSSAPTGLVPLPEPEQTADDEPEQEPTPEPPPTAAPQPTRDRAVTQAPRRPRRSARPAAPTPTRSLRPLPTALVTSLASSFATPPRTPTPGLPAAPLDVGLVGPLTPTPTPTPPAAAERTDPPTDPVTRALQLALGGAALLGAAGVCGLYLTREPR